MGCLDCLDSSLPPEVKELLDEVKKRGDEIKEKFVIEEGKIQIKKEVIIKERHQKVSEADKSNTEALNKLLLEYNKKEIDNEKEIIENEVKKLHCIYKMGLDMADKLKKITLDELKKKLSKAPDLAKRAINSQIDAVNKYSAKEFLDSEFGKPLKKVLEDQGLRDKYLKEFMKKLEDERKGRREAERKEFGISKNEFPPEDDMDATAEELFEAIFNEDKDDDFEALIKKILFKAGKKK